MDKPILKQSNLVGPARSHPAHFCTWCRLKLMQILGFKMTERVQKALQYPDPEQRKILQRFDLNHNKSEANGLKRR